VKGVTILKCLKSRIFSKSRGGGCPISFNDDVFDKAFYLSPKGDPDLFVVNKQPWFRQVKKKQSKLAGFIGA
jgi:hypothetical protein